MSKIKFIILGLVLQVQINGQSVQEHTQTQSEILKINNLSTLYNDQSFDPYLFNYHEYEQLNIHEFENRYPFEETEKYTLYLVFNSYSQDTICSITTKNHMLIIENDKVVGEHLLPLEMEKNYSHLFMYSGGSGAEIKDKVSSEFSIGTTTNNLSDNYVLLAEVLLYDKILSKDSKKEIESRLSIKYGIPLPIDSSYYDSNLHKIYDPEIEGNYKNNVTILGNDDDLKNTQAINIRSKVLEVGLGQITPIQKEKNWKTKRYLCFGDNNGLLSFDPNDRLNRVWKLSGDIDAFQNENLSLKINLDEFTYDPKFDYFLVGSHKEYFHKNSTKEISRFTVLDKSFIVNNLNNLLSEDIVYFTIMKRIKTPTTQYRITFEGPTITVTNTPCNFTLKSSDHKIVGTFYVVDIFGNQLVVEDMNESIEFTNKVISLSMAGTYFVVFENEDHQLVKKIIVQ